MTDNYEEEPPLLWDEGVKNCGGDESMFRMMVEQFEDLSFTEKMEKLFHCIMEMDYKGIKDEAHAIKSPIAYL